MDREKMQGSDMYFAGIGIEGACEMDDVVVCGDASTPEEAVQFLFDDDVQPHVSVLEGDGKGIAVYILGLAQVYEPGDISNAKHGKGGQ